VRAGGNVPHGRSKSVVKSKHLAPFRPHPACFSVSLGAPLDAWKNPTSPRVTAPGASGDAARHANSQLRTDNAAPTRKAGIREPRARSTATPIRRSSTPKPYGRPGHSAQEAMANSRVDGTETACCEQAILDHQHEGMERHPWALFIEIQRLILI
jgi:hypothetical protein